MGAAAVHICGAHALIAHKAADFDVLANHKNLLLQGSFHCALTQLAGQQGFYCGGVLLHHNAGHVLHKILEQFIFGHKVCFGVHLNHNAKLLLHIGRGIHHALGRNAPGLLLGSGKAFFAQPLHSLIKIAAGFRQGFFAVHHAAAGLLTQFLYILCSKCHVAFSSSLIFKCLLRFYSAAATGSSSAEASSICSP